MTLKMSFDAPHHGWLPVRFESGATLIEFDASYTPYNSVQELVDALVGIAVYGSEATARTNLEPQAYFFHFSPDGDGVRLQLLFDPDFIARKRTEVCVVSGSKQAVLLPIWRALRRLEALGLAKPHWPAVDFSQMARIRAALRGKDMR